MNESDTPRLTTPGENEAAIQWALARGFFIDDSDGYGDFSYFNDNDDTPKFTPKETPKLKPGEWLDPTPAFDWDMSDESGKEDGTPKETPKT